MENRNKVSINIDISTLSVLASLLLHGFVIAYFSYINVPEQKAPSSPKKPSIKVINKPKILGKKDSPIKHFRPIPKQESKKDQQLDFSSFQPQKKTIKKLKKVQVEKKKRGSPAKFKTTYGKKKITPGNQLSSEVYNKAQQTSEAKRVLSNKFLVPQFMPPEGISEDEFNSFDKIYYSFIKRTYEKYVNSLVSSYFELLTENPGLKSEIEEQKHYITGRATFDKRGDLVSIYIPKSQMSDSQGVYSLFERTLKAIEALPNPPKSFFGNQETMTIHFSLRIN